MPPVTRINPKDGAVMIYIPPGEFLMGSPAGEGDFDEHPQRRIYLDGYWIYKNDVTVGNYRRFCAATGRKMPDRPEWGFQGNDLNGQPVFSRHHPAWGWRDNDPIVNVNWYDAKAHCAWAKLTLPTEAQWEKAARGTDGRAYPWGDRWDSSKLWCSVGIQRMRTAPVGSMPAGASPYGVLDMEGNVSQWCADWWDSAYYRTSPSRNPPGPAKGEDIVVGDGPMLSDPNGGWSEVVHHRELHGSAWDGDDPDWFRSARRIHSLSGERADDLGFRAATRLAR